MSSHHIIRDNQEPAVFLGEIHSISADLLGQVLEWSPTVICLDKNMEALESQGVKVNVLLRAVDQTNLDKLQADMDVITYQQDYLPALFDYLAKIDNFAIYLVGCYPSPVLVSYADRFSINLLDGNRHTVLVKRYSKWLPRGARLYMDNQVNQSLNDKNLRLSGKNSYEVIQDGFVEIPEQKHYFFLTQEL